MFTAAGERLGAFAWDGGPIVELAWTEEQDLMLLDSGGQVREAGRLAPDQTLLLHNLYSWRCSRFMSSHCCKFTRDVSVWEIMGSSLWAVPWQWVEASRVDHRYMIQI